MHKDRQADSKHKNMPKQWEKSVTRPSTCESSDTFSNLKYMYTTTLFSCDERHQMHTNRQVMN